MARVPSRTYDAVVVGAGIVGSACAWQLAEEGLSVALCDAAEFAGGGATAAGMGHLAVMDDSEPQFALTSYSQLLWHKLSKELPADAEYLPCGSMWVAADDEEMVEVRRKHRFYAERNLRTEILDSHAVALAEPNLRPGMAGALLMPADSVCYPPCAARYFCERVVAAGGNTLFSSAVESVSESGVTLEGGLTLSAGLVIVATGTAAPRLIPGLPLVPRKGHLVITDRYPDFLHHQIIELGYLKSAHATTTDSVAFNAQPRMTGQILIGSSRQFGPEESAVEHKMLRNMLSRAIEYMPGLRDLTAIRTWTGFRAATPDKLPLIGRCPGYDRVFLATGHEGLGISTSLASARLLADEIAGRPSAIDRTPFRADRTFAPHA